MKKISRDKILNLTFSFLFISVYSGKMFSQTEPDTIHIKEVKIFQQRKIIEAGTNKSKLDSLALAVTSNLSLSELLNNHSPVFVKSTGRGTLSTASFRGTDASHTKIYWNGLKINSPMLGQTDLSLVPVIFLDDVTLLPGGSSLSEGAGALGGIIGLENKPIWDKKTSFQISNEIASFGTYQVSGRLQLKKNKWISGSRTFYSSSRNDYPFLNSSIKPYETQRLKNSGYVKYGYLQEIYHRINNDDMISVKFWIQHVARNLPQPMSFEGGKKTENQDDDNLRTVITWKHYAETGQLEITSGFVENQIKYLLKSVEQNYVNFDSHSKEYCFSNKLDYSRYINQKTTGQIHVLINHYNVEILEKVHKEGYKENRTELSMMMNLKRDFNKRLNTYLLLRSDFVDGLFIPVMPFAGLAIKLSDKKDIYLKSSISRNYNIPTLNELYWIPGGNPDLKPEVSTTADLTADLTLQNNYVVLKSIMTGYFSRINNWILWKPTQYHYWSPENIACIHSKGLELNLKTSVNLTQTTFNLYSYYNLCRSVDANAEQTGDQSRGKQLIYIPIHTANLHLGVAHKSYYLNYSIYYTGKRYTRPGTEEYFFETILNPYCLSDIYLGKEFKLNRLCARVQFTLYNLFNTNYQVVLAKPMPGRSYSFIIELSM